MDVLSEKPDEEPVPSPEAPEVGEAKSAAGKAPWSGLDSIVTEGEIKNTKNLRLVTKMLLGEIARQGREVTELKVFRDDYYSTSKDLAVINERISGLQESVTLRSLLYTFGGLLGGLIFLPDLAEYRLGMAILCLVCFGLAVINPSWLRKR